MPLTIRRFVRAAVLVVGCAVALLLGLVAVSRSDPQGRARPGPPDCRVR